MINIQLPNKMTLDLASGTSQEDAEDLSRRLAQLPEENDEMGMMDFLQGAGELALGMGSAIAAEPVSGYAGIVGGVLPGEPDQAGRAIEATQDIMTYKPGEKGQRVASALGELVEPIGEFLEPVTERVGPVIDWIGEKYSGLADVAAEYGGPILGAAVKTAPMALMEATPIAGGKKVVKSGKRLAGIAGAGARKVGGGLEEIAQAGRGAFMPGISEPQRMPLEGPSRYKELWGAEKPTETQFKHTQRLEGLQEEVGRGEAYKIQKGVSKITDKDPELFTGAEEWAKQYGENPGLRELASLYERQDIPLDQAAQLFDQNVNRIEGQSVFDKMLGREVERRAKSLPSERPGFEYYKEGKEPISGSRTSNIKTAGEIHDLDTSKGCIGFCPECYSAYGAKKQFCARPTAMKLTGKFSDDPDLIRRIGTNGEPNMNPHLWNENAAEFEDLMRQGNVDAKTLDAYMDKAYDWSYTNEQVKNVGLDSPGHWKGNKYIPGGRDKTFYITKLQSLKGFDPEITRNLEVSIDPQMPSHFFKALKNIETLKQADPDLNIMMRIRSISTTSDEINALQKMAVDFANKNQLPVLETRLRFKKKDTAAMSQIQDEYSTQAGGSQYKHISYYPSQKPRLGESSLLEGTDQVIKKYTAHTETGPADIDMHLQRPDNPKVSYKDKKGKHRKQYKNLSNYRKGKAPIWEVWIRGEKKKGKLTEEEAKAFAGDVARQEFPDIVPGKEKIWEYALHESPLSQMGLKTNLHKQCATFNNPSCSKCKACRAWIEDGENRAYQQAQKKAVGQNE